MILLDTDTVSLFHEGDPRVTQRVGQVQRPELVGTTVITRVEILQARFEFLLKAADGEQWQRAQHWLTESESFLADLPVTNVDGPAADQFDRLRQVKSLRKIGRADLLIASIALSRQATLVTRNLRHFRQVPGLKVENWID
ncbi:MAG: type II toxin-antitoxin system VapC family toxin [Planctomycetota bacterium]|nr:type II toxin-antitoxin system VapC family toxin [Planctomycetota bacterium]